MVWLRYVTAASDTFLYSHNFHHLPLFCARQSLYMPGRWKSLFPISTMTRTEYVPYIMHSMPWFLIGQIDLDCGDFGQVRI